VFKSLPQTSKVIKVINEGFPKVLQQIILLFLSFFCLFFLLVSIANAQVRVPFQNRASEANPSRTTFDVKGDFALIGNTNLSLENYDDNLMNDNQLLYVDVDNDPNTINSSSATLVFSAENGSDASCTKVLFAGLYWSGRGPIEDDFYVSDSNGNSKKLSRKQAKLIGPNGNQQLFTAKNEDIRYTYGLDLPNDLGLFVGYVEVTDFVQANGQGAYTVADLGVSEGTDYHYGGWSMVVVYENPSMNNRSITVFDGYAFVRGSVMADYTIPVSGFATVDSGPVKMKLGVAAGEGDVAAVGDYLEIEQGINSGNFVRLSHAGNNESNFFNSSISTGGNPRNPELKNNTGMDISVFDIPNGGNLILENGQTSTRFRYGTDGDAYVIYSLVTAVETSEPVLEGYHYFSSLPNGGVLPGEELELTVEVSNKSAIPVKDALLTINFPPGLELISAEAEFYSIASGNSLPGFDSRPDVRQFYWMVGDVPVSSSQGEVFAKITYKVKVTGECALLMNSCGVNFVLDGELNGFNGISGSPISSSPLKIGESQESACFAAPVFGPLEVSINAQEYVRTNCGFDDSTSTLFICQAEDKEYVQTFYIQNTFPTGTRFFDSFPVEESTVEFQDSLQILSGKIYFAVSPDSPNCPREFSLESGYIEVEVEMEEGDCSSESSDRLVTFHVIEGTAPFTFDYLDGAGFVSDSSRMFSLGNHSVLVKDISECYRVVEFDVLPLGDFNFSVEKSGVEDSCPESPNFALSILIESELEDLFQLSIEGTTIDGQDYFYTMTELPVGEFYWEELVAGDYSIWVTNSAGCEKEQVFTISEDELSYLKAEFQLKSGPLDEGYFIPGSPIEFVNLSQGTEIISYMWDFGDGNMSFDFSPVHSYYVSGSYEVNLQVENAAGCISEYLLPLEVGGPALRLPDGFTPNGDGQNDYYYPIFRQIESIRFWVMDRWGAILFYTDSLDSEGWDGKWKDEPLPQGTYVYRVDYTFGQNKQSSKSGSFLLLK